MSDQQEFSGNPLDAKAQKCDEPGCVNGRIEQWYENFKGVEVIDCPRCTPSVAAQGNPDNTLPTYSADAMFRAMAKTAEQFCIERDEARAELAMYREKDGLRTREHNLLTQENRAQAAELAALRERVAKLTQERDWLGGKLHRCRNVMQANDPGNYREIFSDTALTGAAQGGSK